MTVGSLFSGIGGLDLGFERAGCEVKWQVEIDPFCRKVLAKHWPNVRRFDDVRECCGSPLRANREGQYDEGRCAECGRAHWLPCVDIMCGGFPCQDISFAGGGAGLDGDRSGLWSEYLRLIRQMGPRYVVVENVAALLNRGINRVLGDLADLGFDAEWSCVTACAVGLPHLRRRLFIVAYANRFNGRTWIRDSVARAFRPLQAFDGFESTRAGWQARMADPSALYRDADGVPDRLDRNHGIGNAVVPDVAEWIGRRIVQADLSD